MSNDNNNSESFDIDFDALIEAEPQAQSGETFDLDNPFGDDIVVAKSEAGAPTEEPFDLDNPFGDDVVVTKSEVGTDEAPFDLDDPFGDNLDATGGEAGTSTDDSYLDSSVGEFAESGEDEEVPPIDAANGTDKKKKGLLGGLFGGKKGKAAKDSKGKKERQAKPQKEKKEKSPKEKSDKPALPRDWGTILCIAFSVFLFVSLLTFNVATFLTGGGSFLQTLCFLGAFNLVGLTLVAVPVLFYKFPQERTLPNVLLGVSVGALFTSVLLLVNNFYHYYGFAISP